MTDILKRLRDALTQRQVEWGDTGKLSLSFYGNALAGETGEACNIIKKIERHNLGLIGGLDPGDIKTEAMLAAELADIVMYVDLIAKETGVDLEAALVSKFNWTSDKYGMSVKL